MNGTNHYAVLGVAVTAPLSVIKAAHRAQMREHHPDAPTGSEAMAQALNEALRVLQDGKLRAAYDASLGLGIAAASGNRAEPARAGAAADGARGASSAEAEVRERSARVRDRERAAASEAIARERERDAARARREAAARAGARWSARQEPARPADLDVFARGDIDVSTMRWHQREYPPLRLRPAPPRRGPAPRIFAWLALGLLAALACVPAVLAARGGRAPVATALLLLFLVPLPALLGGWARARGAPGTWPALPLVLFLSYAGGLLVPALAGGPAANPVPLAWLGGYLLVIETFRATARRGRRPAARALLDPREIRERTLWEPGPGPAARPVPEAGDNDGGRWIAEVLTGQLLARLDHLPGSRTIHPAGSSRDGLPRVGHAVLCGDRLALLESVRGPAGRGSRPEDIPAGTASGRVPERAPERLSWAVAEYRRRFPGLQVRGWTVLHPGDGAEIPAGNRDAPGQPRLATGQMALREVGDWLAAGEPHVVDQAALSALVLGPGAGRAERGAGHR
ncbi:J domain-containing protein [Paeniglutamicibacter sp. ABSL32-1]|uniref:J domain-containing protein n=1 Tax=Paeniglutamicibacter quisquiliarum TaxID=2849498 RepID=UPI001C2CF80B|nr:J domain-containing protein [Paeniglutamicibacter quisquiliarum]MBV1779506.1 J domain-containing protein [Paeniglutamicibacter quisquiliarum]